MLAVYKYWSVTPTQESSLSSDSLKDILSDSSSPYQIATAMAAEQSLTKYGAGEAQTDSTTTQPKIIVVENPVQMEAYNALYREHQRFRQQIVQMNITAFNNHQSYQQLIIQFNKVRNDLAYANQSVADLQNDLDQERSIVEFGKEQMEMASRALQQEIASRLGAEDGHREESKKVQLLVAIVTRLKLITAKDLGSMLNDEVDIKAVLDNPQTASADNNDLDEHLRQTTFALQCYKNLTGQLKGHNERLLQMIEERDAEMHALRADFGQAYSEGEDTPK